MSEQEPQLEHWDSSILFKNLLQQGREGTKGLEHFNRLPNSLELGVISKRLGDLRQHTAATTNEAGLAITFEPVSGKLLIDRQYTEGFNIQGQAAAPINIGYSVTNQAEEKMRTELTTAQRHKIEEMIELLNSHEYPASRLHDNTPEAQLVRQYLRRPIGTMHSHPNEVPFSVGDIALFRHILETSHISFHVLVRPSGIQEVIIMTPETPTLDQASMVSSHQRWDVAVDKRMEDVYGNRMGPDRAAVFTRVNEAMTKTRAKNDKFGWYKSTPDQPDALQRVL